MDEYVSRDGDYMQAHNNVLSLTKRVRSAGINAVGHALFGGLTRRNLPVVANPFKSETSNLTFHVLMVPRSSN